jgi:hypothetical protein
LTFSRAFLRTILKGAPIVAPSHSRRPLGLRCTANVISSASQFSSFCSKWGTFLSQYASMLERGVRVWLAENASVREWQAKASIAIASPSSRSSSTCPAVTARPIASRWSARYWAIAPNGSPLRRRVAFSAVPSSVSPVSGLGKCLMLRVFRRA